MNPLALLTRLLFPSAILGLAPASALEWGPGGNGSTGVWNTTSSNWWNGSSNVQWIQGGEAVFDGNPGLVTVGTSINASAITFNTAGYTLLGNSFLNASAGGLSIAANQFANISATIDGPSDATLTKAGPATLAISGSNFINKVYVAAGEFLVAGRSSLFFSTVELADLPTVLLTLGMDSAYVPVSGLSGGGNNGGIVQPDAQPRTVTLSFANNGSFNGRLQDNGDGKLAVSIAGSPAWKQTLTNANTYTGSTSASGGTLAFAGNGSALNSSFTVSSAGTLLFDNSDIVNSNRAADAAPVLLQGLGKLQFIGNSTASVEEQMGALTFSSSPRIVTSQPGGAATLLTFTSATRTGHSTLDVTGNGRVTWLGLANGATGILAPFITSGVDWTKLGSDGRIEPLSAYSPDLNNSGQADHVKLTGGAVLAASGARASLNAQNPTAAASFLNLNGKELTLLSGGLLTSGSGAHQITNGVLTSGASELLIVNRNDLTISASIQEATAATVLTKSGAGTLTLLGTNTYSGATALNEGTLIIGADANLGAGTTIECGGGTLKASASFSSTKGFSEGSAVSGIIDTNGFNVTFSGANSGGIVKRGNGTLTLSNGTAGYTSTAAGTLVLSGATSGSANINGGVVDASGALSYVSLSTPEGRLEIGGSGAGTLQTMFIPSFSSGKLTIGFGIGVAVSDRLLLNSLPSAFSSQPIYFFDFANLGGARTGVDYPLIVTDFPGSSSTFQFGISPNATAAGWSGTFTSTTTGLKINFASIPEPTAISLIALGALGLRSGRRRVR